MLLSLSGFTKRYGATTALGGVSLKANPGEVVAIVGENGAGKSTLMKILGGVERPDEGTMTFDGRPYAPRSPIEARAAGLAIVHQELAIAPDLSVAENIVLGDEPRVGPFIDRRRVRQIARDALAPLGHGDLNLDRPAGSLPPAIQQILEIARATAARCKLLVLDEPTSSLAGEDAQKLFTLVDSLRARGIAILYVSHFLDEIQRLADHVAVLRDGQNAGGDEIKRMSNERIIETMVGRKLEDLYPRGHRTPGEVVLSVASLTGTKGRPRGATLDLRRGEVFGIAGLVGAGRTELMRTIFGLDRVADGRVRVGTIEGLVSPRERWRQGVGLLSEDRKGEGLLLGQSIADNVTLASLPAITTPSQRFADGQRWRGRVGIKCRDTAQNIGELSGGNQQKGAIARLLHSGVDIMLLDEPTRGIDIGSKAMLYQLIDDLAREGKAILMISSYLPELMGVCDRIAVMAGGVLGTPRPVGEWTEAALTAQMIAKVSA
jgi:ribose transport system ATP-binding protein